MYFERLLVASLLTSAVLHAAVLSQSAWFSLMPVFARRETKIEVTYEKPKASQAQLKRALSGLKQASQPRPRIDPFLKIPENAKITADRNFTPPPAYIDKEKLFSREKQIDLKNTALIKPALIKPDAISIRKKVSLPPVDLDKINNPSYVSYYQIVREKIRRAAYQNYSQANTGEVYITFVISSDGYLKGSKLVPEKSTAAEYLRQIALKSVKDASPFPDFPKELDYKELSFNVVISFEIE